jgi:hypothetical protein
MYLVKRHPSHIKQAFQESSLEAGKTNLQSVARRLRTTTAGGQLRVGLTPSPQPSPASGPARVDALYIKPFLYSNLLPDVVNLFSNSIVLYIYVIYLHY